jgi:hypothetical protein
MTHAQEMTMKIVVLLGATGMLLAGAAMGQMRFDADGDGAVSRQEFDESHARAAGERFARLDSDADGSLTQAELDAARERMRAHRGERAERIDTDGDGAWSLPELQAVRPGMTAEQFNRLDRNADGLIQSDERPRRGPGGPRGARGHGAL